MSYDIPAIENKIEAILNTVSDLKFVRKYEPSKLDSLPAATLFYDGFEQKIIAVKNFGITHKWILRVYVALNDAKRAQDDIKSLIGDILTAFKSDVKFGDTVLFGRIISGNVGALTQKEKPQMVVEMNIEAWYEET